MKTITALELRARVGQYLDEAAAGERIVVERAGQPLCAIVPLADVDRWDPVKRRERRLAALREIREHARVHPAPRGSEGTATMIQRLRAERTAQIVANTGWGRRSGDADAEREST